MITNSIDNIENTIQTNTINHKKLLDKRWFKVKTSNNIQYQGRYKGKSPWQAGNKALSEIIKRSINNGIDIDNTDIHFTLIETSCDSDKKQYDYIGKRITLQIPVQYTVNATSNNPRIITKSHKNILTKIKKSNIKSCNISNPL